MCPILFQHTHTAHALRVNTAKTYNVNALHQQNTQHSIEQTNHALYLVERRHRHKERRERRDRKRNKGKKVEGIEVKNLMGLREGRSRDTVVDLKASEMPQ